MTYEYDIKQFKWDNNENSFSGDAVYLYPDNCATIGSFPNQKESFFIANRETGNSRRFTFQRELHYINEQESVKEDWWLFKSEDDIRCLIFVGETHMQELID